MFSGRTPSIMISTGIGQNGIQQQTYTLTTNLPTYPNVLSAPPTLNRTPDIYVFAPDYVQPLSYQWSLNLERQFGQMSGLKRMSSTSAAGASVITVHVEASAHLDRLLRRIRELGCKAGVSLNPATPISAIEEVLELVDLVLVMSVNPGFGGQKFIDGALEKVSRLAEIRRESGATFLIEVDGGISPKNASKLVSAGADILVAGSAVFGNADRATAIAELRK